MAAHKDPKPMWVLEGPGGYFGNRMTAGKFRLAMDEDLQQAAVYNDGELEGAMRRAAGVLGVLTAPRPVEIIGRGPKDSKVKLI